MIKIYPYTNDLEREKVLIVNDCCEKTVSFSIMDKSTGEFTGHGEMSREELKEYLLHYGIQEEQHDIREGKNMGEIQSKYDFVIGWLADIFGHPCEYGFDGKEVIEVLEKGAPDWCDENCGEINCKECWKKYMEVLMATQKENKDVSSEKRLCESCRHYILNTDADYEYYSCEKWKCEFEKRGE